jgi:hypothetical protein
VGLLHRGTYQGGRGRRGHLSRVRTPMDQAECLRAGCHKQATVYRGGLCEACWDRLRKTSPKASPEYGVRRAVPPEARLAVGDWVLVAQNHPLEELRGAYARVRYLGDGGALALIELTGETVHSAAPSPFRGKRHHALVIWLLRVR